MEDVHDLFYILLLRVIWDVVFLIWEGLCIKIVVMVPFSSFVKIKQNYNKKAQIININTSNNILQE